MATHDGLLDETADAEARALNRIRRTPPADETARGSATDDPGGKPGVVELVDWMARRPEARAVLQEHLREPAPLAPEEPRPTLTLLGDLLERCRSDVDEREVRPSTLDLRAMVPNACETVVTGDGGSLDVRIDEDVPDAVQLDGEVLDRVLGLLASATVFRHPGDDVELQVLLEVRRAQDGASPVLAFEMRAQGAARATRDGSSGSEDRSGPPAGVDVLAHGVCQELVALMGGSLAAGTGPRAAHPYRFTVPFQRPT